jgi:hypothetical protein
LIAQDPELIDCLFLVSKGIPFDVAFSLDADERHAWTVVMGEFGGLRYNWTTERWEAPSA